MSTLNTESSLNRGANKQELVPEIYVKIYLFCMFASCAAIIVYMVVRLISIDLKNPQFSLKEAEIDELKLSPSSINYTIHLTILSINPNKKLGIYYDDLALHTCYKGERIVLEAPIAPFYIDVRETKPLISTSLVGTQQPLDPYLAYRLQQDQRNGKLELEFKVTGNLSFKSGKEGFLNRLPLRVKCPVQFVPRTSSSMSSSTQGTLCSVK